MPLNATRLSSRRRIIAGALLFAMLGSVAATPANADDPGGIPPVSDLPAPSLETPEVSEELTADASDVLVDADLLARYELWAAGETDIPDVVDGIIRVEAVHETGASEIAAQLESVGGSNVERVTSELTVVDLPIERLPEAEDLQGVGYLRLPLSLALPAEDETPGGELPTLPETPTETEDGEPADPADSTGAADTTEAPEAPEQQTQAELPDATAGGAAQSVPGAAMPAKLGKNGGDALSRVRAKSWQKAGYRGKGVKIGVIDYFSGSSWNRAQNAGDVRKPAGTYCRSNGQACDIWTGGTSHGAAVVEGILDIAPDATVYIASAVTTQDHLSAIRYFKKKGVKIVSRSLAAELDGPGNGTGPAAKVVQYAEQKGMLWVNAAGNHGVWKYDATTYLGGYWRGPWLDTNSDGFLEFTDPRGIAAPSQYLFSECTFLQGLRWNDWGSTKTDYDLIVYRVQGNNLVPLGSSTMRQKTSAASLVSASVPPIENAKNYSCEPNDWIAFAIRKHADGNGTQGDVLELMVNGNMLDYVSNSGSAGQPFGDSKSKAVLSVGAVDLGTKALADYSSRGPLNDGRIKPDISAAAGYTTTAMGAFDGTSASAPLTTGVAALILQKHRSWKPAKVGDYMRKYAVRDRGTKGIDNGYGAGELRMPLLNTKRPKITGKTVVGKKLKVTSGVWSEKVKRSYQWLRNGKAIEGATAKTYKLKSADKGKRISVRVTAARSTYKTISVKTAKTAKITRK